jgi:hypothetical protein
MTPKELHDCADGWDLIKAIYRSAAELCERLDRIAELLPMESIQVGGYKVTGHGIVTGPSPGQLRTRRLAARP